MEVLERTRQLMCEAIRDCLVADHMRMVDELQLPDPDDRHVLAAALQADADVIITFNLNDFPSRVLDGYGVEAEHPDDFVLGLLEFDAAAVAATVVDQAAALTKPPRTPRESPQRARQSRVAQSHESTGRHQRAAPAVTRA